MRLPFATLALAAGLALTGCSNASGQKPVSSVPSGPPKLVVAISVDQFSADLFAQYRQHFTGGLARMLQGAVFPSGYQSHAATETCPGHSTILTGARPNRTGIIANYWFDPGSIRADKRVYCAEDERDPASSARDPVVSARHLRVPTLGDRLKAANPASRNVAVSAKDRSVAMMGGHAIDEGYWWKNGGFVTFPDRAASEAALAETATATALIKGGAPVLPVPAWCAVRDRSVTVGNATIGTGRFALRPGRESDFRVSPRIDRATLSLALRLADSMQLGRREAPDLLSVSLSASDYIGHGFGSEGLEMCIQMAELDRRLGDFLAALDARGIDYVAVLTADHGGLDAPERQGELANPNATRADRGLQPDELAKSVAARSGIALPAGPLLYADGPSGDIYISDSLSSAEKARVSSALVALLRAHPQVAAVFTAQELAEAPLPTGSPQDWSLRDRARASFDAERSGDVVVLLDRGVIPIPEPGPGYVATHGSPWDYDRRVPILFWRRGLAGFEQPAPVETVDIAPTLAAVLGLSVPEGAFDGRCLDIDGSAANSCETRR